MHDTTVSVIIPVYNGRSMMDELIKRLRATLKEFRDYEIIMVDDCSPDDSFNKIREIADISVDLKGIALDNNYGQQSAVFCGIRNASMDYLVIMDDDLEHDPKDILKLYSEIQKGYDVVYALNAEPGEINIFRRMGSKLRDFTFNRLTDKPKDKNVCSFRMITKDLAAKISAADTAFVYISMEILRHTDKVGNIYVKYGTRGRSGHSMLKLIKLLLKLNLYYSKNNMFNIVRRRGQAYGIRETVGRETMK